jgi:pimeloyl-ACP methyl ester carboxylesterase
MQFATNALDGIKVHFEDDGGDGAPVVLHGGIIDSVDLVRESNFAQALQELPDEFRLIYVAHRGVGRSDKPHEVEAYAMPLRVADPVAVLDEIGIERAHFIGNSWGAGSASGSANMHLSECSRSLSAASSLMQSTLMGRLLTVPGRLWPSREEKGVWSPLLRCWGRSPVPVSRMP